MGIGRKEIASKRKLKPPVKLILHGPTSSRIHTNCQQEREKEMWKRQLLSIFPSQTPLFCGRWEKFSNRRFTLDSPFSIQKTSCRKLVCSNSTPKYFLFYKQVSQKLGWADSSGRFQKAVRNQAPHSRRGSFSAQTSKRLSLLITNLQLQNSSEKLKNA